MDLKWGIILEFIVEVKCQTVDCSSAVSGYGREAGCCKCQTVDCSSAVSGYGREAGCCKMSDCGL